MGLVPVRAKEDDYVVIMPGGKVLYVPRQIPDSKQTLFGNNTEKINRYESISNSYIHGIMRGEAYNESSLQTITLV